ncbi:MAG: mechanosensitive ion channel [Lachnospiraceae bacterium]|nr:mechanosensitive ion channel [Lachnospiraceae bacterium]
MNVFFTAQSAALGGLKNALYDLPEKILSFGMRVLFVVVLFLVGVQAIRIIRKLVKKAMEKADADLSVITFVDSFIKIGLYVVLIFLLATNLGVDAASVVALLGSAGVAIGLAVQGSLSNFAGGVLILVLKPFGIGDYIIDNAGHEGTVHEVHIFYTTLLTGDNKTVILPNGTLANNAITNVSTQKTRRIDILVGISYDSDIKLAKDKIMELMASNNKILQDGSSNVFVNELAASSVDLNVRCWVNSGDYWDIKGWLTENVKYTLDEAGISIPFPQVDVHLDK